ncbi:MAG: hypothetical protein C5B51_10650 [Terriglobia bacterium]|nr:MAG: hypothetical protein C5B51_10650 [Terriglobia bacterium]
MRAVVAVAILAALWVPNAAGQNDARKAAKSTAPRTREGKPDLTGVWQGGSTTPGSWEEANAGTGVGGTGKDPSAPVALSSNDRPAGREGAPYQPWAAEKVLQSFKNRGIDDPAALCLPLGLPRLPMLGLFPQQIIQTPAQVVILYEYMGVFRVIPLNVPHPDNLLPSYMGNSVGHWEGDTLVVDVTGFNDKTWLSGTGTFHSDSLHIVERYTRVNKDRINYDVTIEDPKVLTKQWVIHTSMMLREGTRLEEYVCAENNLDPGYYEKLIKEGIQFQRP